MLWNFSLSVVKLIGCAVDIFARKLFSAIFMDNNTAFPCAY